MTDAALITPNQRSRASCGNILFVGPPTDRSDALHRRLEDAGCTVIRAHSVDDSIACDLRLLGCDLLVADGVPEDAAKLTRCTTPVLMLPDAADPACMLRLVESAMEAARSARAARYEDTMIRELLATSPDHISFKDRNGRFTRISSSLVPVFGLDRPEDAVGKSDFDFYPEERARGFFDEEQRMLRDGPPVVNRLAEYRMPDGHVIRGLVTKMPLRDPDGTVIGTYGVARNVNDLLAAQETVQRLLDEKEILLREIHHRLKNDFSLVRSLLLLDAAQTTHPDAARALQEAAARVAVMARTYDQIECAGNQTVVPIRPLVERLLTDAVESVLSNVALETVVDDFKTPPRVAAGLGIVLNELVTNAVKHAFAGTDSPRLDVRVVRSDNEHLVCRFSDNGAGFSPSICDGQTRGNGLSIVHALIEQHDGTIHLTNECGAVIEFTMRAV